MQFILFYMQHCCPVYQNINKFFRRIDSNKNFSAKISILFVNIYFIEDVHNGTWLFRHIWLMYNLKKMYKKWTWCFNNCFIISISSSHSNTLSIYKTEQFDFFYSLYQSCILQQRLESLLRDKQYLMLCWCIYHSFQRQVSWICDCIFNFFIFIVEIKTHNIHNKNEFYSTRLPLSSASHSSM